MGLFLKAFTKAGSRFTSQSAKLFSLGAVLFLMAGCNPLGTSTVVETNFRPGLSSTISGLNYSVSSFSATKRVAMTALTAPTVNKGTAKTFSISPALPAGLSLNTTTGVISGTPTASLASTIFTITASDGASTTSTTLTGTVLTTNSTHSTISASSASIAADGATTSTITVTLKDTNDVPIISENVSLVSSRGATDTVTVVSGTTNGSGVATFTVKSSTIGSPTFIATDSDDNVTLVSVATVTFTAGAATKLAFTTQPSATSDTDTAFAQQPTVKVYDANDNIVTGSSAAITLAASSASDCSAIVASGISATTNPLSATSGVATFANTKVLKKNAIRIKATSGALTSACSDAIVISPGAVSAATSTVAVSKASATADGADTVTITVTLLDSNSNAVAGKTVTVSSNNGGSDTITTVSGTSNVSGVATFTVVSSVAETSTFTASDDTDAITVTQTSNIAFVAGTPTQLSILLDSDRATVGTLETNLFILIQDAFANTATTSTNAITITAYDDNACTAGHEIAASDRVTWITDTNPLSAIAGIADFSGSFSIFSTSVQSIQASATGLTSICQAMRPTPGAITKLAFKEISDTYARNVELVTQPTVQFQDTYGNLVSDYADDAAVIEIYDADDCRGNALNLTTDWDIRSESVTASAGESVFRDLVIHVDTAKSIRAFPQVEAFEPACSNIALAASANTPIQISSSSYGNHFCAVVSDGTAGPDYPIKCWGSNNNGQLGIGTTTPSESITTAATTGIAVATGGTHSCAIKNNGTVWCWGLGTSGQLGDGNSASSTIPVQVSGITTATALALGANHSCAMLSNTAMCWGSNNKGQIGFGDTPPTYASPKAVQSMHHLSAISAGRNHTCAIEAGAPYCWGENSGGQLGDGTGIDSNIPVAAAGVGGSIFTAIASSEDTNCIIRDDHNVLCWGTELRGELGINTTTTTQTAPAKVLDSTGLAFFTDAGTKIVAGANHYCVTANSRTDKMHCWGDNTYGQQASDPVAKDIMRVTFAINITDGGAEPKLGNTRNTTCTIISDVLSCFGHNVSNELNNGTGVASYLPIDIAF